MAVKLPIQAFADVMSCVMEAIDARLAAGDEEIEIDLDQPAGDLIGAWLEKHPEEAVRDYMLLELGRWRDG